MISNPPSFHHPLHSIETNSLQLKLPVMVDFTAKIQKRKIYCQVLFRHHCIQHSLPSFRRITLSWIFFICYSRSVFHSPQPCCVPQKTHTAVCLLITCQVSLLGSTSRWFQRRERSGMCSLDSITARLQLTVSVPFCWSP